MTPVIRRLVALIGGWFLCLGLATTPEVATGAVS